MVVALAQIVAIMLGRFVFMLYSGYMVGFLLLGYIYLYILLLSYIAICVYIYIGISLFIYCFIACLKHGGIAFFISIFYFCSLLRPLFSPNVGTTQTDILYSVTGKKQPLISDTFLISKQINDAEAKPLSLPPSASGSL